MTTQFPSHFSDSTVTVTPTASRVTPEPARPFANVLRASADAVIVGAETAAQRLPGGPLVSAALRPGGDGGPMQTRAFSGTATEPVVTTGPDDFQLAVQAQAENSMYYLQLQQQIQEENRTYSTLSNVLKARHETVKNAIGNIR